MKHFAWLTSGILTLSAWASPIVAQGPAPWQTTNSREQIQTTSYPGPFRARPYPPTLGSPCPVPSTLPGTMEPTTPTTPTSPTSPTAPTSMSPEDALSGAGQFKSTPGHSTSVFAGTGIGSAISGDPIATGIFTPMIIPGLFNAGSAQSAIPINRVSFDYGYFNGVQVAGVGSSAPRLIQTTVIIPPPPPPPSTGGSGGFAPVRNNTTATTRTDNSVAQSSARVSGFNLNAFNLNLEKAYWDGLASFYITVPFLYATDNITGQQINGLGDVSIGGKLILYQNLQTGNTLTGGLSIAFPTAHDAVSMSVVQSQNGTGSTLVPSTTTTINPTFFQPWLAGLLLFDRVYVHEFFGVIVPTDDRVSTFLNNNFTVGYSLLNTDRRLIRSLTPNMGVQLIVPVNHSGTPAGQGSTAFVPFNAGALPVPSGPGTFTFTTQAFLTGGLQLGVSERTFISANVLVPVVGPRGYDIGATFSLSYLY